MDGCTRQDPAYRPANERARFGGPFLLGRLAVRMGRVRRLRAALAAGRSGLEAPAALALERGAVQVAQAGREHRRVARAGLQVDARVEEDRVRAAVRAP